MWGRPSHPLDFVGLLGAAVLFVGALVMYGRRVTGGTTAGVGCLLLWAFYAPAVWATVAAVTAAHGGLEPIVSLPPLLLLASSIACPAVVFRELSRPAEPATAPDHGGI